MATKKKKKPAVKTGDGAAPKPVSVKKDAEFTYLESGTKVKVTRVNEDDEGNVTVDVQEPGGDNRYWGDVPADSEWLGPVKEEE